MYERIPKRMAVDAALHHRGPYTEVLKQHEQQVSQLMAGDSSAEDIVRQLFDRISDQRMLHVALDRLSRASVAGPDGHTVYELSSATPYRLLRELEANLRGGRYRPGPSRQVRIPKVGKAGFRTITVQNVVDRVVAKSAQLVLDSLADPQFSTWSFGGRRRRGRELALAAMLKLATTQQLGWCVIDDVRAAFDVLPLRDVCTLAAELFGARVRGLVETIASTGAPVGIRQGSPLSLLLCNVFYNALLDQPWSSSHVDRPLFRYVDDLLVLASSEAEAGCLHAELVRRCRDFGTPVKGAGVNVCDLSGPNPLQWLGYLVSLSDCGEPRLCLKTAV